LVVVPFPLSAAMRGMKNRHLAVREFVFRILGMGVLVFRVDYVVRENQAKPRRQRDSVRCLRLVRVRLRIAYRRVRARYRPKKSVEVEAKLGQEDPPRSHSFLFQS